MYAPPPNKTKLLEPDLATKLLEPDLAYCSVDVQSVGSSSGNSNNLSLPNVVCFNCRKMGHVKRDCREPFRKNCYRCGYPNVEFEQLVIAECGLFQLSENGTC
ncbi:Zinc knuckle [Popillia japonica]|uniref:Zinc knuckle n=1 Tax=Popillia japonica TaxID=7064 RepID=A0AAW1HUG0_POPJA